MLHLERCGRVRLVLFALTLGAEVDEARGATDRTDDNAGRGDAAAAGPRIRTPEREDRTQ